MPKSNNRFQYIVDEIDVCKEYKDTKQVCLTVPEWKIVKDALDMYSQFLNKAEEEVLEVRGSYDSPGFSSCVSSELRELKISEEDSLHTIIKLALRSLDSYPNTCPYDVKMNLEAIIKHARNIQNERIS